MVCLELYLNVFFGFILRCFVIYFSDFKKEVLNVGSNRESKVLRDGKKRDGQGVRGEGQRNLEEYLDFNRDKENNWNDENREQIKQVRFWRQI